MPPREATNVFPDQFLTLEYDTSGPPAIPHDPTPMNFGGAGVDATNHMNINGGNDATGFEQHVNQLTNLAQDVNNDAELDFENGGNQLAQLSSSGFAESSGHLSQSLMNDDPSGGHRNNSRAHVDPLSIDPTSDEDNPLFVPSLSMEFIQNSRPGLDNSSQPSISTPSTVNTSTSTHVAPWMTQSISSIIQSLSTPPTTTNSTLTQTYSNDSNFTNLGSNTLELLRRTRSNPVSISPLTLRNSINLGHHTQVNDNPDQSGHVLHHDISQGTGEEHNHHARASQNRGVVSPHNFQIHSNMNYTRRQMYKSLDRSSEGNLDTDDEDHSLASLSQPPYLDSNDYQDFDGDKHKTTPFLSTNGPIPFSAYAQDSMPDVQSYNFGSNEPNTAENSPSSHDLLSAATSQRMVSALECPTSASTVTPTRPISNRHAHTLLRNNAFEAVAASSSADNSPLSASTTESGCSSATLNQYHQNIMISTSNISPSSSSTASVTNNGEKDNGQENSVSSSSSAGSPLSLSFGPNTKVSDLKYFAERGCIVPLLSALHTPRLKTLGCRMLADYAKMTSRRVAVASNKRILQFIIRTIHEFCEKGTDSVDWLGREYAVETVRSLTATEESDAYLMNCPGMLKTLALCARGGPFLHHPYPKVISSRSSSFNMGVVSPEPNMDDCLVGLASGRARLHACIAIMNLSCGKSNKVEIAKLPDVLEAMRDAMLMRNPTQLQHSNQCSVMESKRHAEEARLKATTCIKNLSNADANDAALLKCPGLVEALGHVAHVTCKASEGGDATTTTNACLALMNLSISKSNKHNVFRTPGVMDALMAVISQNEENEDVYHNEEAKVKACSALSNLAIGYDNKIPMFSYPGFVDSILNVIETDRGEARTKACSILWSFAAEMKNQVPVVRRGDILPILVRVAEEDTQTEARFKCVAALTLLAESLENAKPLLESGALAPLMDILHDAGPDPTQWKGQTASWCVGFLMNMAQSDEAVPSLAEAGVVELLAPLLTLDHYQSLKAAMAVTFVCRYDEGDETYDLLRKTETVIPKIISLLHNTLSGRGGNGYKYGVFTLRSSVGCIASLASGPDFMKERIATGPVFESLLRVLSDFCLDGGSPGAIVGGGRDDTLSATLAVRALHDLTSHLIPIPGASGSNGLPFGPSMDEQLIAALAAFATSPHVELKERDREMAKSTRKRIIGNQIISPASDDFTMVPAIVCCGLPSNTMVTTPRNGRGKSAVIQTNPTQYNVNGIEVINTLHVGSNHDETMSESQAQNNEMDDEDQPAVRTFLLADSRGRRFAVPIDPSGGRTFNDNRLWCYRRGRFCKNGELPDPNFVWTRELQRTYLVALAMQGRGNTSRRGQQQNVVTSNSF